MRNFASVCLFFAFSVVTSTASAQGFDVQLLRPSPDLTDPYFVLSPAHPHEVGHFSVGLLADFAKNPLVLYGTDGERLSSLVDRQLTAHLAGAFNFTERLRVGAVIPVVLYQAGDDTDLVPAAPSAGFGFGDLRLVPRYVVYAGGSQGAARRGLAIAVEAEIAIPTGKTDDFQGEGYRVEPRVAAEMVLETGARAGASLGYAVRPEAGLLDLDVDDTLTFDVGVAVPVAEVTSVSGELHGGVSVLAQEINAAEVPLELVLGVKHGFLPNVSFFAGAGLGLVRGAGAPDWRVFAGAAFTGRRDPVLDADGDGLLDEVDQCPNDPEDRDEFKDEDGCPDPDNDGDGILDPDDKCPLEPEDADGFEDKDGCVDPDNDGDGILDAADACRDVAEDKDQFEDEDGCPDPDNDKDGLLDPDDLCVNDPEDKDGIADEDGCAEVDADRDGVLDVEDKCPIEPETLNGFEDKDGCPDTGGKVLLTCDEVEIKEKVYFDTGKSTIQSRSFGLLDQLAEVVKQATSIKRLRIEGHTDDRGNDDFNLKLSKDRAAAVREYLIGKGIDPARLEAEGFGETKPIASNSTTQGREQNRRVEFLIAEQDGEGRCAQPVK